VNVTAEFVFAAGFLSGMVSAVVAYLAGAALGRWTRAPLRPIERDDYVDAPSSGWRLPS
jgi:hypothetical protein